MGKGAIKEWLRENTFNCAFGRVSPEICQKLRERPTLREIMLGQRKDYIRLTDGTYVTRPRVCEECKEWRALIEMVRKRRRGHASQG